MKPSVTKELIFSHFKRGSSPLQRELIGQWLREKANEEQYYEWLEEWENKHPQYLVQSDFAQRQFMDFVAENPPFAAKPIGVTPAATPFLMNINRRWWVAAACVFVLLIAGLMLRVPILNKTYATAASETRSFRLADGSAVSLGANSTLRVPRWGFGQHSREVILDGEADFSVRHLPDSRKFVVKTAKDLEVVVLGTKFTVFARTRRAKVLLKSGEVRLQYLEGHMPKTIVMQPGQLVTLDPKNHAALKVLTGPEPSPVRESGRFVFDETTLEEVAYMLEEGYGLRVDIADQALADRVLMGSFKAENSDQLLQSISELLDIDVLRQGNHVLLKENN